MKFSIMLDILFTMLCKKRITASEIAEKYEISQRSAYRYMNDLSYYVPIYTTHGPGGGFSIPDNYMLPAGYLTEREYECVLNALEAFSKELPVEELGTAIKKIKATSKLAREFSLSSSTLMIDSGPWGVTADYNNKLKVLGDCVANSLPALINYRNTSGQTSERVVEPHTIVLKQGVWYIYAYCHMRGEFRLFKVGRIERIIKKDTPFERKSTDGLKDAFNYSYGDVSSVLLELSPEARSEVEEWLGVECIAEKEGKIYATANLPIDVGLVSKLLGYGNKVKVLAPDKLAIMVSQKALEILSLYK